MLTFQTDSWIVWVARGGSILFFILTIIDILLKIYLNYPSYPKFLIHDAYNSKNKGAQYVKFFSRTSLKVLVINVGFAIISYSIAMFGFAKTDIVQLDRNIFKSLFLIGTLLVFFIASVIVPIAISKKQTKILRTVARDCDLKYGADRLKTDEVTEENNERIYKVQIIDVNKHNMIAISELIIENWGKTFTKQELKELIKSDIIVKDKITKATANRIAEDAKFLGANAIVSQTSK